MTEDNSPNNEQPVTDEEPVADAAPVSGEPQDQALEDMQSADQAPAKPAEGPAYPQQTITGPKPHHRFFSWFGRHKKISVPLSVLALVFLLFALPQTRYPAAGLFIQKDIAFQVVDSTTKTPVSGATVKIGSASADTDNDGKVTLNKVKVGNQTAEISKKYYQNQQVEVLVPLFAAKYKVEVSLKATGRQVKVLVANSINKKPIENAEIKAGDVTGKTDAKGEVLLVLPAGVAEQSVELKADGYNDAKGKITVSANEVKQNNLVLTPTGKIYFLSKLSGKIDVVKTNLDGSDRKVVLAGTGRELTSETTLLASPDQKYLALLSRRDSNIAKFYLITTSDDKLTTIEDGNSTYDPEGWSGNRFIYRINRQDINEWKPKKFAIKSLDAQSGEVATIDETKTAAKGDLSFSETIESLYLSGDKLYYSKLWTNDSSYSYLKGFNNTLYRVNPDGTSRQIVKTWDASKTYGINIIAYKPGIFYLTVYNVGGDNINYKYDKSLVAVSSDDVPQEDYNTYFNSPAGDETFWSEFRDGKNSLFVGDDSGLNAKQVGRLDNEYQAYGWFSKNYLLVSKKSSELYVMPREGVNSEADLLKISDYLAGFYYRYY